jgi:hypothetical protein
MRHGVRQGLKLVLVAVCLSPLVFLLEGLLPSRENTIIDELPQLALMIIQLGLALSGIARITYSMLTEPRPLSRPPSPARPRALPSLSNPSPQEDSSSVRSQSPLPLHRTPPGGA